METTDSHKLYWRTHLKYLVMLLAAWFIFGLGCSVLWADALNGIRLAGFPLGFWFAAQGSNIVFVILLFVYVRLMNRLDEKYQLGDD